MNLLMDKGTNRKASAIHSKHINTKIWGIEAFRGYGMWFAIPGPIPFASRELIFSRTRVLNYG
jgi:hypothetical protein